MLPDVEWIIGKRFASFTNDAEHGVFADSEHATDRVNWSPFIERTEKACLSFVPRSIKLDRRLLLPVKAPQGAAYTRRKIL